MLKKTKKKLKKNKIFRKYQDFFADQDLIDPDIPPPVNITVHDFDEKGGLPNPPIPCVVTAIDPQYIKDAKTQKLAPKFRMKSDILTIREIVRKKFLIYATQQHFLDKQREYKHQEEEFKRLEDFHEFCESSLLKMEWEAFDDMKQANKDLKALQEIKLDDELRETAAEHQRALMLVQDTYTRFQFLLKLISYFDHIDDDSMEMDAEGKCPQRVILVRPREITEMCISECQPVGPNEFDQLQTYMERVVKPYLTKKRHLNADVWLQGYEKIRLRMFNYYRRYQHTALLTHFVEVIHDKFKKTYARRIIPPVFLKDSEAVKERVKTLIERSNRIVDDFEFKYKRDKLYIKLNAILPVVLSSIEASLDNRPVSDKKSKPRPASALGLVDDEEDTVLQKVEKIQHHLMTLLGQLDGVEPQLYQSAERRVRRRREMQKQMSKRALVKQNRLHNWIKHFHKHHEERCKK